MMMYAVLASGPLVAVAAYRLRATAPQHPELQLLTVYAVVIALIAILNWEQW